MSARFGGGPDIAGLLSAMPPASPSNVGLIYGATDDNGGALYLNPGSGWAKFGMGAAEAGRGRLNSVKNATAPGSIALSTNTPADLAGYNVTFTYAGRPVFSRARMPLKYSVASAAMQLKLVDVASSKQVYTETFVAPATSNALFMGGLFSDPITALADGTALIVGTSYTWKIQIQGPAGTYQIPVAAATEFYGHHGIFEV